LHQLTQDYFQLMQYKVPVPEFSQHSR